MKIFRLGDKFFESIGNTIQSPFLLLIRLIWGAHFFITGLGKFMDLPPVIKIFSNLDIPFPAFSAFLVATFELIGGISLFLGLKARIMSVILAFIMIIAYITAHSANINAFSIITSPANFAKEAPFSFLFASLVIFVFGPGRFSIDRK